jgi:hypothetical protein
VNSRQLVLQLGQSSLKEGHALADIYADTLANLSHGDDVRGFTEAARYRSVLRRACKDRGYQLVLPPEGDTAIALRGDHELLANGWQPVVASSHKPLHGPRGIHVATFRPAGTRERISVCELHNVRAVVSGAQQLAMVRELGEAVAAAGRGSRLAFYMGDMNHDDRRKDYSPYDRHLRKLDLTSCWDELGRWPATHEHGTTIDVVGSYDPDNRVTCLRARTWHQLHSDHSALSAFYRIAPVRHRHADG